MQKFILLLVLLTALNSLAADRPNILYLYVDDMGWGSIGPNGQEDRRRQGLPHVLTPNLDRLAAAGVNFRRGYGCTVCSPARSSQQTGFHQGHTFADRNDRDNAKKAIRADDLTMGDLLARAGYNTGYWGKWGYGGSKDRNAPTIDNVQTLPTSHGYQHVVAELHHVRAHTFFQPTLWVAPAPDNAVGGLTLKPNTMAPYQNRKNYPDYPARQNDPKYPETAYCDDVYAMAALDFVRQGAKAYNKSGKPFFGLFAAQIPHAPFDEVAKLPKWNEAYRNKPFFNQLAPQSQQWCAMVTRIDAHFGNLLAALEDPNGDGDKADSVAANTLVVFQSDNGGPGGKSRSELAANGSLSGTKGSIYEGGIRVPTIVRWPAKITPTSKLKAGTSADIVIDCTDLLPTFCELAGTEAPVGLDGVSIAPTLIGEGVQRSRDYLIHEAGRNASIIKGRYKLIIDRGGQTRGRKKSKRMAGVQLFDLEKDPAEKNNLAAEFPKVVQQLQSLLLAEHVREPAGFANTYHDWTGAVDADMTKAANWTDYTYANAGITYLKDDGAPRDFWIARLRPGAMARLTKSITVLGLDVKGAAAKPSQLRLDAGAKLTGRNEVRIGRHVTLTTDNATIKSQRWLQVAGRFQAKNAMVVGDYYQLPSSVLELAVDPATPALRITGAAYLSGELKLTGEITKPTQPIVLLQAGKIIGSFGKTTVINGVKYNLQHTPRALLLIP
ncbi:MAG: sulfatase-like hydrolase/transferase [Verrucomicrobiae bacterium]|nr:sulfatase-like hydrolase/transferase [Verrucomicrobiae bacterium]NNJ86934.1 sulfatase-like hydrolase/transferase [Akkermansiaceae bacterium]